jgi:SNF2-related domain/Helicase conserved C-terminal domain
MPNSRKLYAAARKTPRTSPKTNQGAKSNRGRTGNKPSNRLELRDRLGRLTYRAVCRLLGSDGGSRLRRSQHLDVAIETVRFSGNTLQGNVIDSNAQGACARVSIVDMANKPEGLALHCETCRSICEHVAAMLGFVLEEKLTLGLSLEPDPAEPLENLTPQELVLRAIADRQQRADKEAMVLKSSNPSNPWGDYAVLSKESGKTYRVALRGCEPGESYCSCPDFRTNQLGTCKHILHTISKVRKRFSRKRLRSAYCRKNLSLRVDYTEPLGLRFNLPDRLSSSQERLLRPWVNRTLIDVSKAVRLLATLEKNGDAVHIYPDAEEFIEKRLLLDRLSRKTEEIRRDPAKHPLRTRLLKGNLLPYQLDGIAFSVGAGRAILADDMGLGKTIQGIGVAELFAQLADIKNVLVVCPASLKSQWNAEIHRFCNRSSQIVLGNANERAAQYESPTFFKIANYEQVTRDELLVARISWDLIILDEGQRIKNWESKTSRVFKSLKSKFALVLSGTPLENRLEELFTVVGFIDSHRLGPAYRFFHRHRIVDDRGRVQGYKNLDLLRESLQPILLRRTRKSVMQELPERTTEIVRIRPTEEQLNLSIDHCTRAAQIASKPYLTEMDLLRLQKHLLMARMAADSTFLVNKEEPAFSSKLEMLDEILLQISDSTDRKIVLFSEWTTMLDLIEPLFTKHQLPFVRLDGQVSQKKRQQIVHEFQTNPECRAIIMSNAGSTGLNLQSANTVINVDLPWNPAVLEQRIARAHRMGQKNPVHVFLLVTEGTIEERLLGTLAAKQDLSMAALDIESEVDVVMMESGVEELKRRLERLLGKKPDAPVDASLQAEILSKDANPSAKSTQNHGGVDNPLSIERRERVASASGELLGAALKLVSQLVTSDMSPSVESVSEIRANLNRCIQRDAHGRPQLQLTLPDDAAIHSLAETLARILVKPTSLPT